MEENLQHEDLLIKLRGKLNEEKIKLWEPPYLGTDDLFTQSFQELATKYASDLSLDEHLVLAALHELQLRSIERVKANEEFKDTGLATFRIKVTIPKEKPKTLKLQKTLDVPGSELLNAVAAEIGVEESRLKLISNGKLVKSSLTLNEQNVKNGTQLMALVLDASPDEVKKEDNLYIEMKTTRDDATMLSEYVSQLAEYDEYMKLEDQSGKAVDLPPAEKKSLLVGLAMHERGRAAIKQKDYSLALVLLLEADRQFKLAAMALRHNNNDLQAALKDLTSLKDHPQLLCEMLGQVAEVDEDSPSEPDNKLIAELEAMGYSGEVVRRALQAGHNELHAALDLLLSGHADTSEEGNPSTSTAETSRTKMKQEWERKKECDRALERLSSAIRADEDDYLDTSLMEEEQYLAEYKSLL
ncbi:PREDICTED: NEDD8 ultimate buster 1 [Papilio polytes]|uniref:NEDD8 ultimate buster 1 n=1 Tax=Papilio polytes TaxID=76194 RepID=UPI0006760F7A|nr:PREDICTED: NEDD8 ultimate buster 1 [Papilio polytes]